MNRIGVVGPKDSVNRIIDVAKELDENIEVIPFIYKDLSETEEIVKKNFSKIKGWLFSGPTPYNKAIESFGKLDNFDYCSFSDSSLYKCFLQVAKDQKNVLTRLSIDISSYEKHQGAIEELGIEMNDVYVHYYDINSEPENMVKNHVDLWHQGKIDAVITGLGKVYELIATTTEIPVYRNNVTGQVINASVMRLVEQLKISYFKNAQVGFEIYEVVNYNQLEEKTGSVYGMQKLELKIKDRLIGLSEKLNGHLIDYGRGTYGVFSSRGEIENNVGLLYDLMGQVNDILNVSIAVGIGFGDNVSYAQQNARLGLNHVKKSGEVHVVAIDSNGCVIESFGDERAIQYDNYSYDQELLEKLKKANIGIKTYKKVDAVVKSAGWNRFTAAQLADGMSVTERNVRRILSSLNSVGLVELAGTEVNSGKGRPSKVYKMSILKI